MGRQPDVERDGEQQVTIGDGYRIGAVGCLHGAAEHLQPSAGGAQAALRARGVGRPGGPGNVQAGRRDLVGKPGQFSQQRPPDRGGTDDQAPFGPELPGAA